MSFVFGRAVAAGDINLSCLAIFFSYINLVRATAANWSIVKYHAYATCAAGFVYGQLNAGSRQRQHPLQMRKTKPCFGFEISEIYIKKTKKTQSRQQVRRQTLNYVCYCCCCDCSRVVKVVVATIVVSIISSIFVVIVATVMVHWQKNDA